MSKRTTVFHIGANKAGSTTLQKALFARHPEVLSLAKPVFQPQARKVVEDIAEACDRREERRPEIDLDAFRGLWQEAISPAEGRVPVYSSEDLIRYYLYGDPEPARLPEAIAAVAGPLKVVIVARNQLRLIESLYIHKANSATFMPPEAWLSSEPERNAFGYRFHQIADIWAKVVGEENVGVFLFEELVGESAAFASRLCGFIGIDPRKGAELLSGRHENVRKSGRTQLYARLRSKLLPDVSLGSMLPQPVREAWRSYLEGGSRATAEFPIEWMHRLEEFYRSDNRMLARRYGLPLGDYGYPI